MKCLKKYLDLQYPKNFALDQTSIKHIKVRGQILELEGEFGEPQA